MKIRNMRGLLAAAASVALLWPLSGLAAGEGAAPAKLDNATCLNCHQSGKPAIQIEDAEGEKIKLAPVDPAKVAKGVHAKLDCVACHTDIVDAKEKHAKAPNAVKPDCAACHEKLWDEAKKNNQAASKERLGIVVENIAAYKQSFHARPDTDHPDRPKAYCNQCHATHDFAVPPAGTPEREKWRMTIPETCGAACHEDQLDDFTNSVHGALIAKGDPKGAVCTDCHTTHEIRNSSSEAFKLKNVLACGDCHKEELHSYRDTYHGQVNRLGFVYTAKCADCHGSHGIRKGDDPKSRVHPDNRLKTCQKCHDDKKPGMVKATAGFVTFGPHANTHDFEKYPKMWIAGKFMTALLIGVFAFFWLHSGLWYYREWQERKERKTVPHVRTGELGVNKDKHFVRFAWGWRLAHLVFALVTMTLVLTGTTVLFAHAAWAPKVAALLGGPKVMGIIHRTAASLFVGIFMIHFVYVMSRLLRNRKFRWFGPDSLIPNWKDFADCWGMFKWFVGKGPRPQFDRWTYFEKFDYWAVFWGVNIIGWSGLMLAFPHVTASFLPGWVFNVGTLVHGEEAFLAAVFLFTVHFFNNHFRPDKLPPPDVVMFTGTQSLEEFRREHPAQYQRLVESGELEKYLVDAPSRQLHAGSVVLGLTLITVGLVLLVLVVTGFLS
ncbi:cytochrome C [Azoarcus sp. DN11]|uniref:cytochrome C n=1 Tax=Azoarcus sp. DN11 TaxID=356837 RepID=UPI000EB1DAF8|nr:cytochrome C [Azoarcus sp. DN11]AYH45585.1 cytochrome C [Azoarcus sp. DN11]